MPRASERRSPAAQRHADTVRFVLFEARPAGLTFPQLVRSSELSPHQTRSGLACLRDTIAECGWPPLIWTRPDGHKFCADPAELQAYEIAVIRGKLTEIRGKLTEIRRFITGTVAPHAVLQPRGRWIKHLNTQLNSVESTLDVIADFTDA
ncbi:RacP protein [Streptomyces sp. NPDC058676]|uniref:RacP protein n=1 Tax=unclassified Streptomyces TaxID=2593676 RepID=UPI0036637CF0